ncbi:DUF1330 domain-containing protein [Nocardia sp. NPDC050712]|uniref:DUF1330 domain-containing protein n=1 Tax=Nocardia sp. NPDC050712 TaxID=3155518 RepID=UPI0033EC2F14
MCRGPATGTFGVGPLSLAEIKSAGWHRAVSAGSRSWLRFPWGQRAVDVAPGQAAVDPVEGDRTLTYPVLIEFPDLTTAHRWYDVPEYQSRRLKAPARPAIRSTSSRV